MISDEVEMLVAGQMNADEGNDIDVPQADVKVDDATGWVNAGPPEKSKSYKIKLCQDHMKTGKCPWWNCHFAHGDAELNPDPANNVHWVNDVGVGELCRQQFGIIEKRALNVVCNRNSPLGNPFVTEEPRMEKVGASGHCSECWATREPGAECNCLIREEHDVLCEAFLDYFQLMLQTTDEQLDETARTLAESVAQRRGGLLIARRWAWHAFSKRQVMRAVRTIETIYSTGTVRIVLLCHCGTAKPCHALHVQQHVVRATSVSAVVDETLDPPLKCSQCWRDWLWRGALDSKRNRFFCSVCWSDYADWVFHEEEKSPLEDAPLLQPLQEK